MKYLFLSLVLLNILYGLWQLQGDATLDIADATQPEPAPAPPPSVREPAQPDAAALCVTLGKFTDQRVAEQLRQRLLVLDIESRLQTRDVVVGADYWLVMPVVGGERHAVIQLSALQEQGIDSFLITRGEMAGSLSLGVFSREDHAQVRQEQLQQAGLDVRLHVLNKKEQQYVVEVGSKARRLVDQAMLTRLRADFPGLQHQYELCQALPTAGVSPRMAAASVEAP